jgi:hypothetical protein
VIFAAQLMASMKWIPGFADFTQAFHPGDPIDRELYAEQPAEGLPGVVRGQLIKLLKTCYGLTDGPYTSGLNILFVFFVKNFNIDNQWWTHAFSS